MDAIRVTVRPGVRLSSGDGPDPAADFTIRADADLHNFARLEAGVPLGWVRPGAELPLRAAGPEGRDVSDELFTARAGALTLAHSRVPVMLTTDPRAAQSDCLFYAARHREEPSLAEDTPAPPAPAAR